jgi:hypothetical protein
LTTGVRRSYDAEKKFKLSSDDEASGSKKRKRGYGGAYGLADSVCWWESKSGVRRSVLRWCNWYESGFSRCEDVFTFNLLKKEIL